MVELNEDMFNMSDVFDPDQGGITTYGPQNNTVLNIVTLVISTIGITVSALCLVLLLLTATLFAEWRKSYKNQLLIQFMIARYVYTLVRFFYDLRIGYQLYEQPYLLIQIDLYFRLYTEMALVAWMYVFSKSMYDSLVTVFNVSHMKLWKVSLCAWLIPAVLSGVLYTLLVLRHEQGMQIYIIHLALVKWPVLTANAILLILVVKSILTTNKSKTENNGRILVVMIILIFAFCFQQFIIDIYKVVSIYLYLNFETMPSYIDYFIIASNLWSLYYCAFSILFWLFGNAHTRRLWKFKNNRIQPQNSVNSRRIGLQNSINSRSIGPQNSINSRGIRPQSSLNAKCLTKI